MTPMTVSFRFNDQFYDEIYRATWYQKDAYIHLEPLDEEGLIASSYGVDQCLPELAAMLEEAGIRVDRVQELKRFDLDKLKADVLPQWQEAFRHAEVQVEGCFRQALESCPGVDTAYGQWDLELDDDMQWHLVEMTNQQRYKVLTRINQNDRHEYGDYLFTAHHCWCPTQDVLHLTADL